MDRSEQAVHTVEGGDAVGLGHGRVVEGGLGEITQGIGLAALRHDGLADVHVLRRLLTEAMIPVGNSSMSDQSQLPSAIWAPTKRP